MGFFWFPGNSGFKILIFKLSKYFLNQHPSWLISFNSWFFKHMLLKLFSAKATGFLFSPLVALFGFFFFHIRKFFFKFSYHSCPSCRHSPCSSCLQLLNICFSFLELLQKTGSLLTFPASKILFALLLFSSVSKLYTYM